MCVNANGIFIDVIVENTQCEKTPDSLLEEFDDAETIVNRGVFAGVFFFVIIVDRFFFSLSSP